MMLKKLSRHLLAWSLALGLLGACAAMAAAPTDYRPAIVLGNAVCIRNGSAYATPFLSVPSVNDLEFPMGIYLNGVQGYELERSNGFVKIAIGGNGLDDGISGFVQEEHVVPGQGEIAPLPSVTLSGKSGNNGVSLHLEYAEDTEIIAFFQGETAAELLGFMDSWCHVRVGGIYGFVKTQDVSFSSDVQQGITSALPAQFDDYTPQQKHAMDITGAFAQEMREMYGERRLWPLEVKAEEAALSISLGRGQISDFGIDILPGAEDLPQAEALEIAKRALKEERLLTDEQLAQIDVAVSFMDYNWALTGRHWCFEFTIDAGDNFSTYGIDVTISSPDGEVVGINGTNEKESIATPSAAADGSVQSSDAYQIACKALMDQYGWSQDAFEPYLISVDYYEDASVLSEGIVPPCWVVCFDHESDPLLFYSVTLSAQTGEVQKIFDATTDSHG